jgi:hypothetical protein
LKNIYKNYIHENNDKSGWISSEKKLKKKDNEVYNHIIEYCHYYNMNNLNFKEKVYYYYNNLKEVIKCKICDNNAKYYSLNKGYGIYCSEECRKKDGINIFKKVSLKTKEIYGYNNPSKDQNIVEKRKKTNIKKYGGNAPACSESILNKMKNTNLNKLGVEYPSQNLDVRNKYYKTVKSKNLQKINNLLNIDYNRQTMTMVCDNGKNHKFEISISTYQNRKKSNSILCTKCNHSKISSMEIELLNFIEKNYNRTIIKSSRQIIKPYELDIYLPDINLAFEFNGLYWHSNKYKDINYHKVKSDLCEEKGIQLIHIWEDDWIYKQDIIKSILLNKFNKNFNKIYARNCKIKEVGKDLSNLFLKENNINEINNFNISLGLFSNNKLVFLMVINQKEDVYDLLGFCGIKNTSVIGAVSKLLKYFTMKYKPKCSSTSIDRSYYNGNIFKKIGFKLVEITKPKYCIIVNGKRENINLSNNNYKIYNSGILKFIL